MTKTMRRLATVMGVVMFTSATAFAQQSSPKPTPAASQTPTPTPTVPQRFEQPGIRTRPTPRIDDLREIRYSWGRPIFRVAQSFELKVDETASAVRGILSDLRIDGHVHSDVVCIVGDVTLGPQAVIDGSLVVIGGNATIAEGAKVEDDFVLVGGSLNAPVAFTPGGEHVVIGTPGLGRALRGVVPWITDGLLLGRVIVPGLGWVWEIVAIVFFIGLVLNLLFNRAIASCSDTLARRPLGSFLMGLLVMMLLPIVFAILAASVVGLVVVPFVVAALVVAVILGRVAVSRALGRMLLGESDPTDRLQGLRSFTIGAALLVIAYMIPVLGLMAWMFVGSFALGSATMTAFSSWRREKPVPPPKPAGPPSSDPGEPLPSADAPQMTPPMSPPSVAYSVPLVADSPPFASASAPFEPAAPFASASSGAAAPVRPGDLTLYPRAGFLDRLAAVALDFVLVGIAAAFLGFDRFRGPGPFFMLVFAYHLAFWGWKGTTLGGIICSLRIVRTSREPLRFIDAVVRGLSAIFSFVAIGIGYFWMLHDPERQTWHDKIAGTIVVKVPRELLLD
jgi:uncharacterized RDD family membrane protein YckC